MNTNNCLAEIVNFNGPQNQLNFPQTSIMGDSQFPVNQHPPLPYKSVPENCQIHQPPPQVPYQQSNGMYQPPPSIYQQLPAPTHQQPPASQFQHQAPGNHHNATRPQQSSRIHQQAPPRLQESLQFQHLSASNHNHTTYPQPSGIQQQPLLKHQQSSNSHYYPGNCLNPAIQQQSGNNQQGLPRPHQSSAPQFQHQSFGNYQNPTRLQQPLGIDHQAPLRHHQFNKLSGGTYQQPLNFQAVSPQHPSNIHQQSLFGENQQSDPRFNQPRPQIHDQSSFGTKQHADYQQSHQRPQQTSLNPPPSGNMTVMGPRTNMSNFGPGTTSQTAFQHSEFQEHTSYLSSYPHMPGNEYVFTIPPPTLQTTTDHVRNFAQSVDCKVKGLQMIRDWLYKSEKDKLRQKKRETSIKKDQSVKCTLWKHIQNLSEIKKGLTNVMDHITKMELIASVADSKTWDSSTQELESEQGKFKHLLPFLEEMYNDERLELLNRSKQKRARLSKSKRLKYDYCQLQRTEWNVKSTHIDEWQDKKTRRFREKNMKTKRKVAADLTLSKVTKEIHDANKLVETMVALEKLRLIRRDAAEKRGDADIGESRQSFEQKIADMTRLVNAQLEHYKEEETRLKSIIKSEVEESDRKLEAIKKEAEQFKQEGEDAELQTLLFGSQSGVHTSDSVYPFTQFYKQGDINFQAFLQIRHDWDSYLVPDSMAGGSEIPSTWVVPDNPSNSLWAKCQI